MIPLAISHWVANMLGVTGFADSAQGFVVPVVGAAAGGYALLRIARQDQNWDGLIDGLKSENKRKDEEITAQRETISKMSLRLAELASWEHQKGAVEKDLANERGARKRALERLSAKQIELARLEGAIRAAGIDPKDVAAISDDIPAFGKPSPTSPIGVLLLDDDPLSGQLVADSLLLKRPTWTIRRAASEEEAKATDLHGIDVVVSDWQLAGGETAADYLVWLQTNHPTKFVVVLSGHPEHFLDPLLAAAGLDGVTTLEKMQEAQTGLRGLLNFIDNTRL